MNNCEKCGKKLIKRSQIRFCSLSCSASINNLGKRRHGISPEKNCIFCGKKFISSGSRIKFCSLKCSSENIKKITTDRITKTGIGASVKTTKEYLLKKNGNICCICKNTIWNNLPIPLVMDHIDGNPNNNKIINLRLVCGNCDMQLPTYKGKNKGNGRFSRKQRYKNNLSF